MSKVKFAKPLSFAVPLHLSTAPLFLISGGKLSGAHLRGLVRWGRIEPLRNSLPRRTDGGRDLRSSTKNSLDALLIFFVRLKSLPPSVRRFYLFYLFLHSFLWRAKHNQNCQAQRGGTKRSCFASPNPSFAITKKSEL